MNRSVDFFAHQFTRQIAAADYALNPFERRALPYLRGTVLDLGCGLGNLALQAARRGLRVTAIDACAEAVADIERRARAAGVHIDARSQELSRWRAEQRYDTVVSIGLAMFFPCAQAKALVAELRRATAPGGTLVLNVLIEGTTFVGMFDGDRYCLWSHAALRELCGDWDVLEDVVEEFPAGQAQLKRFATLVVRRPSS